MKSLFLKITLFLILCCSINNIIAAQSMELTFSVSNYNGSNVSCFGSRDGQITVNISGGKPPYTFLWSNDETTQTITGLSSGFYNVIVTDSDSVQVYVVRLIWTFSDNI